MMIFRLLILAAAALWAAPAWACPPVSAAKAAFDAGDLDAAAALASKTCLQRQDRRAIQRLAALTYLKAARAVAVNDPQRADALLSDASRYQRHWRVMFEIGWRARARRQFEDAAQAFALAAQDATISLEATPIDGDPAPSRAMRAQIVNLLDETQLVLGRVVKTAARAACEMSNDSDLTVKRAAPITFEYGQAEMTRHGLEAADVLFQCLARLGSEIQVAVLGHTDQVGSDDYNCRLSLQRANAVVQYLRARGLRVTLRAAGLGERAPFTPASHGQYTQQEIDRMNRRVEVDVPPRGRELALDRRPLCR